MAEKSKAAVLIGPQEFGEGVNVVVNVIGGGKGCVKQAIRVSAKTKANIVAGREMIDTSLLGRRKIEIRQANGHSYQSVELAIQFIPSGKLPMDDISTHTTKGDEVAVL